MFPELKALSGTQILTKHYKINKEKYMVIYASGSLIGTRNDKEM